MVDPNTLKLGDKIKYISEEGVFFMPYGSFLPGEIYTVIEVIKNENGSYAPPIIYCPYVLSKGGHRVEVWYGTWELVNEENEIKVGDYIECVYGLAKGIKGVVRHIGKLDDKGDENSIWSDWDINNKTDKYGILSYLKISNLIKIKGKIKCLF